MGMATIFVKLAALSDARLAVGLEQTVEFELVEDRLVLGPDLVLAALFLGALPVELGHVLAVGAAGDGGAAVGIDALVAAAEQGDGQRVGLAVLDPDQLAAAEHRHEHAAQCPLQRIGADPLDPFVDRPVQAAAKLSAPGASSSR